MAGAKSRHIPVRSSVTIVTPRDLTGCHYSRLQQASIVTFGQWRRAGRFAVSWPSSHPLNCAGPASAEVVDFLAADVDLELREVVDAAEAVRSEITRRVDRGCRE